MNYILRGLLFPIICLFALHSPAAGVSRCECLPTERLPADLRAKSEALLLKALDSEALYTIIGGLKPMSSGFASFKFSVEKPDLAQIEETRRLLSVWRCGDMLYAYVQHFATMTRRPKKRSASPKPSSSTARRWPAGSGNIRISLRHMESRRARIRWKF
jgi:hypothetical protein